METTEMITRYVAGDTAQTIATHANLHLQTILNRLRKAGVPIRTRGHYPSTRKNFFQEAFFSVWTPDMAYVLGLVATDGNIQGVGTLRIYQKETDLLDQVQGLMGSSFPYDLCGSKKNPIPTLRYHSRRLVQDLVNLGVHPNKSLTLQVPLHVPFPQDYIRGVFDGDGHGGFYKKRKKRYLRIGFTSGSKEFLLGIKEILPVHIGGPYKVKGGWGLQTTSEKCALELRDWMYQSESQTHSKRKKLKLYPTSDLPPGCQL